MKKIVSVLLCMALFLSLAACGGSNDIDSATKNKICRGEISFNTYTNDFIGIKFKKPITWKFFSDDEMADRLNIGMRGKDLSDVEAILNENESVFVMTAQDATNSDNVSVCFENTMLSLSKKATADEYADRLNTELQALKGFTYELISTEDTTLGSQSFKKLTYTVTVNDTTFTSVYYIKIIDNYAVCIRFSAYTMEISEMEAMFS